MRNYSFIKVFIAVLTIAFAVSMGTVPVSAQVQPPVSVSNVTQMRTCELTDTDEGCGTFDNIAPNRWVQRQNDGKAFQFVEVSRNKWSIGLRDASRRILMDCNFSSMICTLETSILKPRLAYSKRYGIRDVYEISADNSPDTCKQQTTAPGAKCNCDLRSLRPLQGAVGMEEVRVKAANIRSGEKTRLHLAYDPIKIVRGPNGLLYVTDHHHGALAWLQASQKMGTCQIQTATISTDPTQFWADLTTHKLVHLADKNGAPITVAQLPTTLETLPDDPYRALAWRVRKGDGFCRALMTSDNLDFAQFQWADWLRKRSEFKNPPRPGEDWSRNKKTLAIALAKTEAAKALPGYHGNTSPDFKCPADPD